MIKIVPNLSKKEKDLKNIFLLFNFPKVCIIFYEAVEGGCNKKMKKIVSWESHLVIRAADGDQVAFELLSDMFRSVLMSQAMRMLRNADDANDAVQETLVKAFRAIKDFDSDRPLKPWLSRICQNCCVDAVRLRRKDGESLDQHEYMLTDESVDVNETATGAIRQGQVVEAISRLPEKYREIIVMRHFRHMDVIEIAEALDKPEGTIKSWLFRARAMLKKDLTPSLG
ncbi:N/A [soil metagenome]